MNKIFRILACAALLVSASAAKAELFEYSYSFGNGSSIYGNFQGTANGNLINGLSNFSVYVNGIAFPNNGNLEIRNQDGYGTGVMSFDGTQTNLLLVNSFQPHLLSHILLIGAFQGSSLTNLVNYATPQDSYANGPGWAPYSTASWHVTAVPEPVTSAMLLAGLALIGGAARRRKASRQFVQ
jgi:hypothetical protein